MHFVNLGVIYKISGRLPLALDCYKRAIQISPDFQPAYLNLGNLLQLQGNFAEALDVTRKALSKSIVT